MSKVIGIGGIFFKARDPEALRAWYAKHLGMPVNDYGATFEEDASRPGVTLWAPFKQDSNYFAPSSREFMLNLRVDDLDALLAKLRADGVEVDANVHEDDNGRFGWIMDPEGTRIELWQPPAGEGG
ncbi:MAG TPA: VOC family protein [Rhodanobacteraceae bacterium]|nr:VOC family protein [Rhodanobacteraceae bacterium]